MALQTVAIAHIIEQGRGAGWRSSAATWWRWRARRWALVRGRRVVLAAAPRGSVLDAGEGGAQAGRGGRQVEREIPGVAEAARAARCRGPARDRRRDARAARRGSGPRGRREATTVGAEGEPGDPARRREALRGGAPPKGAEVPSHQEVGKGHGRVETRTASVCHDIGWRAGTAANRSRSAQLGARLAHRHRQPPPPGTTTPGCAIVDSCDIPLDIHVAVCSDRSDVRILAGIGLVGSWVRLATCTDWLLPMA